jgi:hypothetical protein
MFSIASSSLFGQDAVNRRPAYAECCGYRARRFAAGVHALRQSSLLLIKHLGPSDVLPACPTCLACRCPAFPTKFQFKRIFRAEGGRVVASLVGRFGEQATAPTMPLFPIAVAAFPPIGGHAIHPPHRPFSRQTEPSRHGGMNSWKRKVPATDETSSKCDT